MNKLNEALQCDSETPDVSTHQTGIQTQDSDYVAAENGHHCTHCDVTAECGECEGDRTEVSIYVENDRVLAIMEDGNGVWRERDTNRPNKGGEGDDLPTLNEIESVVYMFKARIPDIKNPIFVPKRVEGKEPVIEMVDGGLASEYLR